MCGKGTVPGTLKHFTSITLVLRMPLYELKQWLKQELVPSNSSVPLFKDLALQPKER